MTWRPDSIINARNLSRKTEMKTSFSPKFWIPYFIKSKMEAKTFPEILRCESAENI